MVTLNSERGKRGNRQKGKRGGTFNSPILRFPDSPILALLKEGIMLQVFSMPCGFLEFDSKLFFPNLEKGELFVIPVPSYLITHPKGNVVFDTGVHCQA